ncbi:hypothetical protein H5410_006386 [Solanum commersonii]|uniref:DUF7046 domain-containing protein n=1 Tax=Solanum commersonii TaxID=4109 RepID=A0A9J6A9P8_SOLCO|nr:hypothetical protein H5410_006386 [Solanum commersonii]
MDGNKTRFWKDNWHEKGNMEDLFPDIYNLIMFQQSTIADLWSPQGWNFIFRRNLNDWEIVRVAEFLNTVNTFTGLQLGEDKLWWTGDDKGVFKVNKSYKLMDQTDQPCSSWPWMQIWKSRIPHKVSFFVWCFLCGETSETVNHLFLHCKYTHHLWRIFLSLKGSWEEAGVHAKDRDPVMHSCIEKTLYSGHTSYKVSLSTRYLDIWESATLAIKRDGYSIKANGPGGVLVSEKFSQSTIVTIPYGSPTEFSIFDSRGVEHLLKAENDQGDINCSRDTIVLTMRLFIIRAGEKKKGRRRGLFFNK